MVGKCRHADLLERAHASAVCLVRACVVNEWLPCVSVEIRKLPPVKCAPPAPRLSRFQTTVAANHHSGAILDSAL